MLNRLMYVLLCMSVSCEMMICINQCVGVKKQNNINNNNNDFKM